MKNKIVSREEWNSLHKAFQEEEKAFTRERDVLSEKRRSLPWVRVEDDYRFDSENGSVEFPDLFQGKTQLVIYHFMFGPDWKEGCKSCSFWADNYNSSVIHLRARDVSLVAVSNGPIDELLEYRKRMGWSFPWYSSLGTSFNHDFNVSCRENEAMTYSHRELPAGPAREMPGISVFYMDEEGAIFHTYSAFARGLEDTNNTYRYLDIVPKGRNEDDLAYGMEWVRRNDEY